MIFSTIEDEATLSGHRITNIFSQVASSIRTALSSTQGVSFGSSFTASLTNDQIALQNFINELGRGIPMEQAFANTMREASVAAQQYAQNTNVASLSVGNFVTQQKMSQISSLAQGKSLGNIKTLLNEYNSSLSATANGVTNCGLKQADFVNSVGQSNSILGKYLTGLNGANASMKGYIGTLIASKAATIGLRIATTALNAVIGMGIGLIVSWIMSGISTFIESIKESCKSAEEKLADLNTKFQEISESAKTAAKDFQNLKTSIADIAPRFAELSQGVDAFGQNISLTDEEYEEFIRLNNEIAELFPELNVGMDSNGNAMLALSGTANQLEQSLLDLVEAERKLANEEIAKKIPDQVSAITEFEDVTQDEIDKLNERLEKYKEAKEELNHFYTDEAVAALKENYGDNWEQMRDTMVQTSQAAMTTVMEAWGQVGNDEDAAAWQAMIDKYVMEDGITIDWHKLINSSDFANRMAGFEKQVASAEQSIKDKWQSLASYMNSWVQTNDIYNSMDDQMQAVVSQMVSNLDYGSDGLDSAEEIKQYITDKILTPLSEATPEVRQMFADMFAIKTDDKTTAQYIAQIKAKAQEIADNSDFTYDEVLKNTGYEEIIGKYEGYAEDIVKSLDGVTTDMVYALSPDDVARAFDYIKDYGISSWDELITALENNTFETVMDFSVESEGMDNLFTAMKESVASTGLTADSISKLKARYKELEDYDAASLFEKTANGIHLNTKELRELESAYEKQQKQAIDNKLSGLGEQYKKLTEEINNCKDATKTAELYAQRDNILDQINDTSELAAMYDGLTSAFYRWEQAQSIGEEGDMYDSLSSGLEHIKELFDEGLVGTNEFRAAVQLMTNQDLSTANIDELIAAYNNGYSKMTRYFTDGSDGCLNFLKDVQSLNSEWAHMNEDGSWEINFGIGNDEEIANKLGINVETVQSIMRKLSDYGFDVNLDSEVSQLGYLKTAAEEANDKLKELGKTNYTFNFNTDDVDYLNEEIEEAKKILDTFKKDGKIDFEVDGAEEAQGILATLLYQKQSLETNSVIVQVEINNPDTDIEKVVTTLQKFRSEYNRLKVETEVGADTTEAQANVDALISELKNSNPEILATLGIDTTNSDTVIASIKNLTPEMLVSAGLDASLVEGYDPEDKSSVVTYNYDSSAVDNWKPPTKYGTVIYTATNVGGYVVDKLFGGKSKAQGTAYSNGKYGRYGTKDSGVALVGELGQEMVVRDGEYFTIGDNSAEMFKYEKDDIIFNAEQTRQILENGKITNGVKRGKSYARGTAFSNATGTIYASGSVKTNPSGDSSSDSKSKDSDDKIEAFDWIEIAINRIERAIDRLKKTAESTYKALKTKLGATADEITKVNQEIALQQQAYNRYMQEANSVGLDAGLAEKVRNGTIDINQYDEDTRNLISDYQDWYEKALDCSDAIDDLHESLASLYEDNFNNVKDDFENQLTLAEHLTNQYETGIDMLEARGYLESTKYYAALQDATKGEISILNNELAGLEQAFSDAMNSGEIEKYSEAWYSMQAEINGVKEEIAETNVELAEYAKTMREIEWGYFDYTQERISQLTQEADFLIDLMSNSDLHTDKGQLTDEGMATMGLHGQNYNTHMAQADMYAQEILEIDKELAKDPYNTELIERREELLGLQQDSILAAEDEKQAIVALVEEGINLELQAMQDLIDKYTESLDTAKDLYEYQKKIKEQAANVASLQKQLSAYENDLTEETRAKVQKLTIELAKAEEELAESEYEQYISDQKKLLDELYLEYETILNQRLDNVDALIGDMITAVNDNSGSINETLTTTADNVGYTMTTNMQNIWNGATNALDGTISKYGDDFSTKFTAIQSVLSSIQANTAAMVAASDDEAKETVDNTTTTTKPTPPTTPTTPPATQPTTPAPAEKTITVGGKINAKGAKIYDYAGDKSGENQYFSKDPIYTVLAEKSGYLKVRHHKLSSGVTGWFKKSDVKAYKTGGLVDYTGLAKVDGTPGKPELMLNAEDTKNFLELRDLLRVLSSQSLTLGSSGFGSPTLSGVSDLSRMLSTLRTANGGNMGTTIGDIEINIPIEKVEDYNDFVTQLQNDPQFEKMLLSMTVDRIAGGSSLAKYKYKWK